METKPGCISKFTEYSITCILTKDYELDDILKFPRERLTKEQSDLIEEGQMVRYNKKTETIEFMLPNGKYI